MDAVKECCSLEGHIKGIKFYDGFCSIRSMMNVHITREANNPHDSNAVLVSYRGRVIGLYDSCSSCTADGYEYSLLANKSVSPSMCRYMCGTYHLMHIPANRLLHTRCITIFTLIWTGIM